MVIETIHLYSKIKKETQWDSVSSVVNKPHGNIQVTVIHQDRSGAAVQPKQWDSYRHTEPLPLDEAKPAIDVRTGGSRIQQIPSFFPQARSGNYREILGRTLISDNPGNWVNG